MKTIRIALAALSSVVHAYSQWSDNFSDGDFTNNPSWGGDVAHFTVISGELRSNGPSASSVIHLYTQSTNLHNTQWEFYARVNLNQSSSNFARVYLVSDVSDVEGNVNGYYVQLGGATGTADAVDLYRQQGNSHTKIISGVAGRTGKTNNNIIRVRVIRDHIGNWALFSDTSIAGIGYQPEGRAFDNTFLSSSYFAVYVSHTSTNFDKYFFDNFNITVAPLGVSHIEPISASALKVFFNKPLSASTAQQVSNYMLSGGVNTPILAIRDNDNHALVHLTLDLPMQNNSSYTLTVTGVEDIHNNPIGPVNQINFTYTKPVLYGDILITEIFADPTPRIALPEFEFLEIYNSTNDTIRMQGYKITDGTSTATFPDYKLPPSKYLILCSNSAFPEYSTIAPALGLSSFPSLNNAGETITLFRADGMLVYSVTYADSWYKDNDKKQGGWTLEMIDLTTPCSDENNWTSSTDPSGGTPGKINSVNAHKPDLTPPVPVSVFASSASSIKINFDEKINADLSGVNITISPNVSVLQTEPDPTNPYTLIVKIQGILEGRTRYNLQIAGVKDCIGNSSIAKSFVFGLPQPAEPGDVALNELLFNPMPGGTDFVELYNASEKYINLKNWKLANLKDTVMANIKPIFTDDFVLNPGEYIAFTEDKSMLLNHYPKAVAENIFQIKDIPSYNDDRGTVFVLDADNKLQQRFDYNKNMHHPLLDDEEGVSLERINPLADVNDANNWHSAAESVGYATPGYKNSHFFSSGKKMDVWLEPDLFTPNNDGYKDFLLVHYNLEESGYTSNIVIYDAQGREVKRLARNQLLAREGFFQWDGTNDAYERVRSGTYIVYVEMFNLKGDIKKYKLVSAVGWSE